MNNHLAGSGRFFHYSEEAPPPPSAGMEGKLLFPPLPCNPSEYPGPGGKGFQGPGYHRGGFDSFGSTAEAVMRIVEEKL